MEVELRSYAPQDFEILYRIDQVCYPAGIAYSRSALRWFLRLPEAEGVVARAAGEIAGFLIAEREGASGHILTLDVLPEHRRRGIGTALLVEAERRLAARGVTEVGLETATDNHPAVAFWHKHGYREIAVIPRYYLGKIDAHAMRKSLSAPPAGPTDHLPEGS